MKVQVNPAKWKEASENWKGMCRHRASKATAKADFTYYKLYSEYFDKLDKAIETKNIIAHVTSVPTELFYAIGLVPLLVTSSTWQMTYALKNYQECLDIAHEHGLLAETCSVHRMIAAFAWKGWFPEPAAFVYAVGGCDAFCGSPRLLANVYETPVFCIDTPYTYDDQGIKYLAGELQKLVDFLEDTTGRKMDWDALRESLKRSKRQLELFREIRELRKSVPSPMENRRAWQMNWMNWIYAGDDKGIEFMETLRNELKERVTAGTGMGVKERFRLIDLFMPPSHAFRLLDWMQQEYGATICAEGLIHYEDDVEIDPDKPLESMARKWCGGPLWNELVGSAKVIRRRAVNDARECKADGAIWWDTYACRQAGAIRMTKDALLEEVGIPTLQINCDIGDPKFVSYEEMQGQLRSFFEVLEARV